MKTSSNYIGDEKTSSNHIGDVKTSSNHIGDEKISSNHIGDEKTVFTYCIGIEGINLWYQPKKNSGFIEVR